MSETILAVVIGESIALLICLINNHFQMKSVKAKHDETIVLMDYKLTELTKKVEKHNNLVERMYKLEDYKDLIDEKIKVINHRIDDLEKEE